MGIFGTEKFYTKFLDFNKLADVRWYILVNRANPLIMWEFRWNKETKGSQNIIMPSTKGYGVDQQRQTISNPTTNVYFQRDIIQEQRSYAETVLTSSAYHILRNMWRQ